MPETIADLIRELEAQPLESSGHLYHPLPFPEFAHLTTSSDASQAARKWRLVERGLKIALPDGLAGKRVLDVGANAGYYSFVLAQAGASVTAFEPDTRYARLGAVLAREKKLAVDWRPVAFSADLVSSQSFDVALMMSVFQWMAEGGERLAEASASLRAISRMSRYLFFELGFNTGTSSLQTSKRNHYAEVVALLRASTVYTRFLLLGRLTPWGPAPRYLVLCSNDAHCDDAFYRRLLRAIRL